MLYGSQWQTIIVANAQFPIHANKFRCTFCYQIGSSPSSAASPKSSDEIKQARRRLSVMSDNKLVEGFETSVTLDEPEEVSQ